MRRNNAGHNNNINISQATSLTSARTGAHIILGGVEYIDWMLCYTTPYSSKQHDVQVCRKKFNVSATV